MSINYTFVYFPPCLDDFSCAIESKILMHGRMYVTSKCVCFYSNMFGVEKKVKIPHEKILTVKKLLTALIIPNAIIITTTGTAHLVRYFCCFVSLPGLSS
jgi:hypothetical protein